MSAALIRVPAFATEGALHVVVESPSGATSKIEHDPDLDVFTLSRPLPLRFAYPHDGASSRGTRAEDGDPFDALVLSDGSTYPGLVLRVRPVALVDLEQNRKNAPGRERNDRIIA